MFAVNFLRDCAAIHFWHVVVEDDDINRFAIHDLKPSMAIPCSENAVIPRFKDRFADG